MSHADIADDDDAFALLLIRHFDAALPLLPLMLIR